MARRHALLESRLGLPRAAAGVYRVCVCTHTQLAAALKWERWLNGGCVFICRDHAFSSTFHALEAGSRHRA